MSYAFTFYTAFKLLNGQAYNEHKWSSKLFTLNSKLVKEFV
jgi:hypothetical protein